MGVALTLGSCLVNSVPGVMVRVCFPWLGVWDLLRGMMIIVMGVVGGFVGLIGLVNAAVSS